MKHFLSLIVTISSVVSFANGMNNLNIKFSTKIQIEAEHCEGILPSYEKLPKDNIINKINLGLVQSACNIKTSVDKYLKLGEEENFDIDMKEVCFSSRNLLELAAERFNQFKDNASAAESYRVSQNLNWATETFNRICDIPGIPLKFTTDLMIKTNIKRLNF